MPPQIAHTRLIRALLRQPVDRPPIWIMRQAGRYLPEYRVIRKSVANFMDLCRNPELATEVTLQPLRRFDLDAAIVFSDILTIPDAMGLKVQFMEGEGPQFNSPIRDNHDIQALKPIDVERDLGYVLQTIQLTKHKLHSQVPLIGFAGSPWTLATYMVEGGASKNFSEIKKILYTTPELLHDLLSLLTENILNYLNAQIAAGVNVVMLFDTWGGILTKPAYLEFSLAYMQKIIAKLKKENREGPVPSILFTKGGGLWLEPMATTGCNAIGVDWTVSLADAKRRVGTRVALQGNLDPSVLYGAPEIIQRETKRLLAEAGNTPGFIFNLGHGIYPDTNPDHVRVLVDTVRGLL